MAKGSAVLSGERSAWLVGLGVGLCIAATEVQRYTVMWPSSLYTTTAQERFIWLLGFLTLGFALLATLRVGRGRGLYQMPLLSWAVAALSCAGVVIRSLATFDILSTGLPVQILIALTMELPYFLMPIWASWLLAIGRSAVMRVVPLGIIVAGFVQILVSLLLGHPFSHALAAVLAPASVVVLHALSRRRDAVEPQASAPSNANGAERVVCPSSLLGVTCALIVVASLVVYVIHSQWTGLQDQGPASLLVQICTGCGMLVAGVLLRFVVDWLAPGSITDFCFMLVLPAAVAGLYLSHAIDGVALVVSVIPLNVVYATLLFFVWSVPAIYSTSMAPDMLSMLVFFLKRVGILICPFFISMFTVLGVDLIWMTFGAIIALISLDVARYLIEHGGSDQSEDGCTDRLGQASPVSGGLERACQKIASDYGLTTREGDVLRLLGRGRTARHIAGELGMSDATVKTHIAHIYRKLGINSQQSLLDIVEEHVGRS